MKRFFALSLLSFMLPTLAHAQGDRRLGFFAGRGVELLSIRDGSRWAPGTTWQAGFYVRPAAERWSLRAVASFYDETQVRRTQALGFAVETTYDLSRGATRPYLLAGAGASLLYLSPSRVSPFGPVLTPGVDRWSGFFSVGGGVQRKIAGFWVFGEARYNVFTNGRGWAPHILPVTFGIRF